LLQLSQFFLLTLFALLVLLLFCYDLLKLLLPTLHLVFLHLLLDLQDFLLLQTDIFVLFLGNFEDFIFNILSAFFTPLFHLLHLNFLFEFLFIEFFEFFV